MSLQIKSADRFVKVKPAAHWRVWMLLFSCIIGSHTIAEEVCETPQLKPYDLNYQISFSGFTVESNRKLAESTPGHFQSHDKADFMFLGIRETAEFALEQGLIQPLVYEYERIGMSDSKDYRLQFFWNEMQARNQLKGDNWSLPLQPGMFDSRSHQEQMRLDLACASEARLQQPFDYLVAKKNTVRNYHYEVKGEETLETKMGPLKALKVEKMAEDNTPQIRVWLAKDWNYIILRLDYLDGDDGSLQLLGGTVGGLPVTALTQSS